ncbi:hypothetical protein E5161_07975 [Cohnella pontilimi]|uniref:Uncharacterized protein n=1 Tax=Cohnella pontilimi TaxID=2564100 RepID=A0A4U0FDC1_9BACL|nr:hypothetical protein [Cohnella pontilimi]TJY42770.1 hypothetical protein E5161_07975 [Cohnella pontilimi]
MNLESFYCLQCGALVELERASTLFRTGYYRIEYRMGICVSCAKEKTHPHPDVTDQSGIHHAAISNHFENVKMY